MLIILLYHRIGKGKYAIEKKNFLKHIQFIKSRYPTVLPNDPLKKTNIQVCLTFDDAYYSVYKEAYPLLLKHRLKAVIAVPTKYILEKTAISEKTRLSVTYKEAFLPGVYKEKAPFCTWKELKEMRDSGLVSLASHSHSHRNLKEKDVLLEEEFLLSKTQIQSKGSELSDVFVFPFGQFNRKVKKQTRKHYPISMRIGHAANFNWSKMLYRIHADAINDLSAIFSSKYLIKYLVKYFLHKVSFR